MLINIQRNFSAYVVDNIGDSGTSADMLYCMKTHNSITVWKHNCSTVWKHKICYCIKHKTFVLYKNTKLCYCIKTHKSSNVWKYQIVTV